jgi:hypothetical protein
MSNFSQINSLARAQLLLKNATPDFVAVNADYVRGNHFRKGDEWIGPPVPPEYTDGLDQLEKTWVPIPIVNECLEGHTAGIVGKPPAFEFVLKKPPAKDASEEVKAAGEAARAVVNTAVGNWADARNVSALMQEWTGRLRWAGRAPLRLSVPPLAMVKGTDGTYRLPAEVDTPEKALEYIFVESPNVEVAMVHHDPRSARECGLFRYDETEEFPELGSVINQKRYLEKVFVADADAPPAEEGRPGIERGKTVLQTLESGLISGPFAPDAVVQEVVFPCGGFSLMFEAKLPLLFTDPARRQQRAINMISTLLAINATYAGFRGKEYFNVTDTKADDDSTDVVTGATSLLMWYAQPYTVKNKDGTTETKYMPPTLITTEPVDSAPLIALMDMWERQLRRWFRQEHTLFSGGNDTSAVALVQMRAAFLLSLLQTKPAVEDALVWLQNAAWCFALYLCGKGDEIPEFLDTYRATAQAKPYTGPLTPDEIRVVIEMVTADPPLMSREIAVGLLNTDDLDAEIDRINKEDSTNPTRMLARAQIVKELMATERVDIKNAATLAGFSEEQINLLVGEVNDTQKTS